MAPTSVEADAKTALQEAGCQPARAQALVKAIQTAAGAEALALTAGSDPVYSSVVDARVARLGRIIEALGKSDLPNRYEVGAIFRITPSQAQNVLNTYRARYAHIYRERMESALAAVTPSKVDKGGDPMFVFEYADPAVLDYAEEQLRRRGITRSVSVDNAKLTLTVPQGAKDRDGNDAARLLKGKP